MKLEDLKNVLETLQYGLNECIDQNGDKTTHFNSFANSISIIENEIHKIELDKTGDLITVEFLMDIHKNLNKEDAQNLKDYANIRTIYHKKCYGKGESIYPDWVDLVFL